MEDIIYSIRFKTLNNDYTVIVKNGKDKIGDLIKIFLEKIKKSNLLINNNIDNIWFEFNAKEIVQNDYNKNICDYFEENTSPIILVNTYYSKISFEIIDVIKENIYTSVYKARLIDDPYSGLVAVKKIFKDKIKDEMKFVQCKEEITEEDFKPEIIKFNNEILNMKKLSSEYSVKIIDYYDTKKEFIIVMELCDETLFHVLCRKKDGFSADEIREILLQLNEVFKKMNELNISHRDIKLNNILVKYLNKEKTKFKVLLSDYGISNQLCALTQKFTTHAGSHLIMAPEILNDKPYNNKCDLWSLGVIIYQLYTKQFPYYSPVEKGILDQIETKGKTVLNVIKDEKLKNLLSKLLEKEPNKRISWKKYFKDPFFGYKEEEEEEEEEEEKKEEEKKEEEKKEEEKKEEKKKEGYLDNMCIIN